MKINIVLPIINVSLVHIWFQIVLHAIIMDIAILVNQAIH